MLSSLPSLASFSTDCTSSTAPLQLLARVLVCMIYYPDEHGQGSWADTALSALDYNANPHRLQHAISYIFREATSKIDIDGVTVVPVPLFSVMDGKNTSDYIERVEPSSAGGQKMARLIVERLLS
eukprot:TRINITY_DN18715_c0_g1_i2.p1 TRINITY_DN18715_c0_g1~~TRINITY_DN18715_c0_g1_i2.p1  ORF type:complete len:125 (+),score=22.16 TRINITY_DN18715_c0_g1_i2:16-390(+)